MGRSLPGSSDSCAKYVREKCLSCECENECKNARACISFQSSIIIDGYNARENLKKLNKALTPPDAGV